jgi:hypothetical protein
VRQHPREEQGDVALRHRQNEDGRQAEAEHQVVDELKIHKSDE